MLDTKDIYKCFHRLSLSYLQDICNRYCLNVSYEELVIILNIIRNEPYPFVNNEHSHYLLSKIKNKTNENIYTCIKEIINNHYLWENL
ncbi:MAG: hypothetical protein U0L85_06200 [Bacilli bacterium]|nr:hypothetical protein [Bacilli bacterium]